jgi:hypothetical protein
MLFVIADKHDIAGHQQLARDGFKKAMGTPWQRDESLAGVRSIYLTTPPQQTRLRITI